MMDCAMFLVLIFAIGFIILAFYKTDVTVRHRDDCRRGWRPYRHSWEHAFLTKHVYRAKPDARKYGTTNAERIARAEREVINNGGGKVEAPGEGSE